MSSSSHIVHARLPLETIALARKLAMAAMKESPEDKPATSSSDSSFNIDIYGYSWRDSLCSWRFSGCALTVSPAGELGGGAPASSATRRGMRGQSWIRSKIS